MALNLILMRHAKSSWGSPDLSDHDRPLKKRGRASATALGDWLRRSNLQPDQLLSSSSARTVETCARLALNITPELSRDLYLASAETMLDALKGAKGHCVLMLGHNPGIGDLAAQLARHPPADIRFLTYPTGATTVYTFHIDTWDALRTGTGEITGFIAPRDLD